MSEPAWVPLGAAPAPDPGVEVAYGEFTAPVSITATSEATAQQIVAAPAFTADGISTYFVEFFAPAANPAGTSGQNMYFALLLDGVSIGLIGLVQGNSANPPYVPIRLARRITPAAGARTFSVRAYVSLATGTVYGGAGGTGLYVPGFIRISKVPSGVQIPTWSPQPVAVVTSLPASPVDGQEIILVDSLTAPTFSWHLKFIAAKASNKWVAVGGDAVSFIGAQESRGTAAAYADLGTVGPQITVPVAGLYLMDFVAVAVANGGWTCAVALSFGGVTANDGDGVVDQPGIDKPLGRMHQRQLAAGTLVKMQYRSDGSHTAQFYQRTLRVTPTAVGG